MHLNDRQREQRKEQIGSMAKEEGRFRDKESGMLRA